MTNKQAEEVISKHIYIWFQQDDRTNEQIFAVKNFMTGQGLIMLETAIKEAEARGSKKVPCCGHDCCCNLEK